MRPARAILLAVLSVAAFVGLVALGLLHPRTPPGAKVVLADVGALAAALGACTASLLAASRSPRRTRIAWTLLAAATLSWGIGQAIWTYHELRGEEPFPSFADVGYLATIPLAAAALLTFPTAETGRLARTRALLDAGIVSASFLLLSWVVLFEQVGHTDLRLELVLSLAYPTGDVVLASLAILLILRIPWEGRLAWRLLGWGILAFTLSDLSFAYLNLTTGYASGTIIDLGWLAGMSLLGLAAVVSVLRRAPMPELAAPNALVRTAAPFIPICIDIVFVSAFFAAGGEMDGVILTYIILLAVLLISRQLLVTEEVSGLTRKLEVANDKLRATESERTQLLNVITHDLAAPLAPISFAVELMQMDERAPLTEEQRRSLELIERNAAHLRRLVDDVKDLARLQTGSLGIQTRPVLLGAIVEPAVDSFRAPANARGVRLDAEVQQGLLVEADAGRLTQVLYNLIGNALKFTPSGGVIRVAARARGERYEVTVQDSGRGMTHEEIGKLFQPFRQVHAPGEVAERGTGLGLFISRGIARQHRGDLWVESPGLHLGSTFHLLLPATGKG